MKHLISIVMLAFALTSFATTDTAQPTKAPDGMMLAKKKDHSKDKVAEKKDATKSPSKDTKKAETPKK